MNQNKTSKIINEIDNLNNQQQEIFEQYAKEGFLDNLAMILVYMEPERASNCLKDYSPSMQKILSDKMKQFTRSSDNCMLQAVRVLADTGFDDSNFNNYKELIKKVPLKTVDIINLSYQEKNPVLVASLVDINNYFFEDLIFLDDRAIQKLLRETDSSTLEKALKNTSNEMIDKICRNMSLRAKNMLLEDMEFMGPIRLKDIEEAQEEILVILKKLVDEGSIIFPRDMGDELIG